MKGPSLRSASEIISEFCADGLVKDLRRIIAKIKNVDYEKIVFDSQNVFLNNQEEALFFSMLDRYKKNEPLSKILGEKSFWDCDFFTNSDVLDPRPETELIIEMVLERFDKQSSLDFLDVGTGSGCILLSLLREYSNSRGVGVDISPKALEVAKYNQKKLEVANANFVAMDWNDFNGEFDIIVSNPPYIKTDDIPNLNENVKNYDPTLALDGGSDGLDAYASIIPLARKWLKPNGSIFLEVGCDQAQSVSEILQSNGFRIDEVKKDLCGIDRVIAATPKRA